MLIRNQNSQPICNIYPNKISVGARSEQIRLLKGDLKNTDTILIATEIEMVRIPNANVNFKDKGEFLTKILSNNE